MIVTPEEMKQYLRVDFDEEDALICLLTETAEKLCMDILRVPDAEALKAVEEARAAVMYAAAYLYEHREEADHRGLTLTLRSLLFGSRKEAF